MNVFGPVPSRRLGKSIGINNIPPKTCSYSCVYCQLGITSKMQSSRQEFYSPEDLINQVEAKIKAARRNNEKIDYLTIIPDGEPTLDKNIGKLIKLLKKFEIKIAVITNATLLSDKEVQNDLMGADWVSVKIDSVTEDIWRKTDRPHRDIKLKTMLDGIEQFALRYGGVLVTETMLVKDCNDTEENFESVSDYLRKISPAIAYISIPTRPPADKWVNTPNAGSINDAFQIFSSKSLDVEYLIGYEGNQFAFTGDIESDILSITSVHPMREEAIQEYLEKAKGEMSVIDKMVKDGKLLITNYHGMSFYIRKLK
ncbi:MAG: radical SAM protein [Caldisericia bacterium]|nr:radical SAM protein [Caldisericia bacterium]